MTQSTRQIHVSYFACWLGDTATFGHLAGKNRVRARGAWHTNNHTLQVYLQTSAGLSMGTKVSGLGLLTGQGSCETTTSRRATAHSASDDVKTRNGDVNAQRKLGKHADTKLKLGTERIRDFDVLCRTGFRVYIFGCLFAIETRWMEDNPKKCRWGHSPNAKHGGTNESKTNAAFQTLAGVVRIRVQRRRENCGQFKWGLAQSDSAHCVYLPNAVRTLVKHY